MCIRDRKNVVSYENDVTQVLAEIELGQADVGFVYYTDAKSAGGKVKVCLLYTSRCV